LDPGADRYQASKVDVTNTTAYMMSSSSWGLYRIDVLRCKLAFMVTCDEVVDDRHPRARIVLKHTNHGDAHNACDKRKDNADDA